MRMCLKEEMKRNLIEDQRHVKRSSQSITWKKNHCGQVVVIVKEPRREGRQSIPTKIQDVNVIQEQKTLNDGGSGKFLQA